MEKHTVKMEAHVCCMEMEPWDANALKCLKEFIAMIVGSWCKIQLHNHQYYHSYFISIYKAWFYSCKSSVNPKFSDKCSPEGRSICMNGGSCSFDVQGNAMCMCPPGVMGEFCDISMIIKKCSFKSNVTQGLTLVNLSLL